MIRPGPHAHIMDQMFPQQLFPNFYLDGPPEIISKHSYGGWGSYERVFESSTAPGEGDGNIQDHFEAQHTLRGDQWVPVKPAVTPVFPPSENSKVFSGPLPDPMDFPEHIEYFYQHHCMDAFSTMGDLLQDLFSFKRKCPRGVKRVMWLRRFLKGLNYKRCHVAYYWEKIRRIHHLFGDVLSDIPMSLLSELLHEELTTQREQQQVCVELTGGVLGYMPLYETQAGGDGCLIYPNGSALDTLNFHRVVPEYNDDKPPSFFMDSKPYTFQLTGSIRQISLGKMEEVGNVAVRTDCFCSAWLLGDTSRPRLMEVIKTKDRLSCVTVSPHIPEEVVVATEGGSAYLWTVKRGFQKLREEDCNLYFNAKSTWRWCEFSCHPRVVVFADRTGVELTDARIHDSSHTLFRIGKTPACRRGERVMLTKYLSDVHANHHLITTQFSAYIIDERMPCVPMLKWDHMMESKPLFACVLPGTTQSNTCKVFLGASKTQEVMLLQYKGGRKHACQSYSAVQKLYSPRESLNHLNHLLPHRRHLAQRRLNIPAAGLTAIQNKDYMSVFQLTETGDLFYQTLKLHKHAAASEDLTEPPSSDNNEHVEGTGENMNTQSTVDNNEQSSHNDEAHQAVLDHSHTLDTNEDAQEPSSRSVGNNSIKDVDFQTAWNQWFTPLFKKAASKKRHFRHQKINTKDLISLNIPKPDKLEEDRVKCLRRDLHEVMRKKGLVIQGATYLPHLNVTPVPDSVDPVDWQDDLSQRLTASWKGEWKNWWEEKLGFTKNKKIEALRKKRLREKRARGGSRISLSASFTSSNFQDNLSGWSSAPSQYLGSDDEIVLVGEMFETEMQEEMPTIIIDQQTSLEEPLKSALKTPQTSHRDVPSPFTSQSKSQTEDAQSIPSTPRYARVTDMAVSSLNSLTPSNQSKRHTLDLNSLFGSQEPTVNSEPDGGFSFSQVSSSSQLSLFSSQRPPKVRAFSQLSQPKKKSRMGF